MAAVLQCLYLAPAPGDGPIRCPTRHRYAAQLPVLRARLILPGIVGSNLPASFGAFAAWGDFATGVLAILALLTTRIRPLFWSFVIAFNLVGAIDILVDYYHATQTGLPAIAGQLGTTYAIPIIYVPLLMITHFAAFYLLVRPQPKAARFLTGDAAAS